MDAQVLIQAGHEGGARNSGSTGSAPSTGTNGTTVPERQMTPIVADTAALVLVENGITVVREDAFYDKEYEVDLAVSLHFDGSSRPGSSGASIGYPAGVPAGSNKPTADLWRSIYEQYWPFEWMPDNFTPNLRGYYGYRWTSTSIAELLIEFGEITDPVQDEWLQPRLAWLGQLVAHFASEALGLDVVPDPGPFDPTDDVVASILEKMQRANEIEANRIARLQRLLES